MGRGRASQAVKSGTWGRDLGETLKFTSLKATEGTIGGGMF